MSNFFEIFDLLFNEQWLVEELFKYYISTTWEIINYARDIYYTNNKLIHLYGSEGPYLIFIPIIFRDIFLYFRIDDDYNINGPYTSWIGGLFVFDEHLQSKFKYKTKIILNKLRLMKSMLFTHYQPTYVKDFEKCWIDVFN